MKSFGKVSVLQRNHGGSRRPQFRKKKSRGGGKRKPQGQNQKARKKRLKRPAEGPDTNGTEKAKGTRKRH